MCPVRRDKVDRPMRYFRRWGASDDSTEQALKPFPRSRKITMVIRGDRETHLKFFLW